MPGDSIKDWPAGERPRERLSNGGPMQLSDAELLAVMLGRGIQGLSAMELARSLLARFGGIRGVLNASLEELQSVHGVGPGKATALVAARECCCRYLQEKLTPGQSIRCKRPVWAH